MTVTLNINNDDELRAHVKELISGQVKSIVREEIKDILREILSKKIQDKDLPAVDFLIKDEVVKAIKKELDAPAYNQPGYIKKIAREEVEKYVQGILAKAPLIV